MAILQDSVKYLMNPQVISVLSNTPILIAIDILLNNNHNGIPVTDKEGVLVGILTKYDLIIKRGYIRDDTKVGEVMNKDPLFLRDTASIEDAIQAFSEHHKVDPIPVVSMDNKIVGMISRYDMVRLFKEYGLSFDNSSVGTKKKQSSSFGAFNITFVLILMAAGLYLGYIYGIFSRLTSLF